MNSDMPSLMIYGANGYSAGLVLNELIKKNIKPILAGRNEIEIKELAEKYSCPFKIFGLENSPEVIKAISGVHILINCAGPFRYTAKELMDACLESKTNYLDITGEIPVMALAFSYKQKAIENGIVILPSVGFDIIPTDCLAKRLSEKMPDAISLKLGFINKRGEISRGTLLTSLEFIGSKGKIRRDGKIIDSEFGEHSVKVSLPNFSLTGISIPWGDVYSAYQSTRIPNITVYIGLPKLLFYLKPILFFLLRFLKNQSVKKFAMSYVKNNLVGPSEQKRNSAEVYVWGKVENAKGEAVEEVYQFIEGYNLTALGAAESALKIMNGEVKPGTYTPSLAFGSKFMDQFVVKEIYKSKED